MIMKKRLIAVLLMCIILNGCESGADLVSLKQPVDEIQCIELLYCDREGDTVLYTLSADEISDFAAALSRLRVYKHWSPSGTYGYYAAHIYYLNDDIEIIGTDACSYYTSSADEVEYDGWHYVNYDELYELFAQYADRKEMREH